MVPSSFVVLPELPLLPNGKLDRKSLPAPETRTETAGEFAAPVTDVQKQVAQIWQRVLGIERIGLRDNFFEIGGDSLMGLRVVNRLREALNEHVSLVVIFEAPTVERLCEVLERNYAEAVQRWLGVEAGGAAAQAAARITEADVLDAAGAGDADAEIRRLEPEESSRDFHPQPDALRLDADAHHARG